MSSSKTPRVGDGGGDSAGEKAGDVAQAAAAAAQPGREDKNKLQGVGITLRRSDGDAHDVGVGARRSFSQSPQHRGGEKAKKNSSWAEGNADSSPSYVRLEPRKSFDDSSTSAKATGREKAVGAGGGGGGGEGRGGDKAQITINRTDNQELHHLGHKKEHLRDHLQDFFKFSSEDAKTLINKDVFIPVATGVSWSELESPKIIIKGRLCEVYEAVWRRNGGPSTRVAVKIASSVGSALSEEQANDLMRGEIWLLSRIHHPNIIHMLGAGDKDGRPFIITEYLPKGTMFPKPRAARGPGGTAEEMSMFFRGAFRKLFSRLHLEDSLKHALEISYALEYLHMRALPGAAIVHGDLRADNIGFGENGAAKILDFSTSLVIQRPATSAARVGRSGKKASSTSNGAVGAGEPLAGGEEGTLPLPLYGHLSERPAATSPVRDDDDDKGVTPKSKQPSKVGAAATIHPNMPPQSTVTPLTIVLSSSLRYMAPEVAVGQPITTAADIYSFGLILWSLVTGKEPFGKLTRSAFYGRVVVEGERPELPRNLPPEFQSLLTDCWKSNPDERPRAHAITVKLAQLLGAESSSPGFFRISPGWNAAGKIFKRPPTKEVRRRTLSVGDASDSAMSGGRRSGRCMSDMSSRGISGAREPLGKNREAD